MLLCIHSRIQSKILSRYLYTHIHSSSIIHNSQVEATLMSYWQMNKQNVAYTYNGILFSLIQKEILTCITQWMNIVDIMLNKKDKCHLRVTQLNSETKEKNGGCQGLEEEGIRKLLFNGFHMSKMKKRSWASPVALVVKNPPANAAQEMQVPSLGREDPLEKEMATHSSILAWKIPWTEEPGRLQSIGLQRVRHDWAHTLNSTLKCG